MAVETYTWRDGDQVVAELHVIHGGGHVIPQPVAKFPRLMGKVAGDLDAPRLSVIFFGLDKA